MKAMAGARERQTKRLESTHIAKALRQSAKKTILKKRQEPKKKLPTKQQLLQREAKREKKGQMKI